MAKKSTPKAAAGKPAAEPVKVPAFYMGLTRSVDGSLGMKFRPKDNWRSESDDLAFTPKQIRNRAKGGIIGRLYALDDHGEGHYTLPTSYHWHERDLGETASDQDVLAWETRDQTSRTADAYAKHDRNTKLDDAIRPLAAVRRRLPSPQRAAFDAYVLHKLREL